MRLPFQLQNFCADIFAFRIFERRDTPDGPQEFFFSFWSLRVKSGASFTKLLSAPNPTRVLFLRQIPQQLSF